MIALLLTVMLAGSQAPAGPLAAAVRRAEAASSPVWIAYRVPMIAGSRRICFDGMTGGAADSRDLHLAAAPASELIVYARFEGGHVARVRVFTPDCPVEPGDTPVVRVESVASPDSVAWLAAVAAAGGDATPERVVGGALLALSLHADPSALPRLIDLARDDPRGRVRGQALFWLAQRAGDRAVGTIAGAVENDPDAAVRKKAVFALSQLPRDEGVPKLIELARSNAHPDVRKQAIFWLGQSNDPRAVSFFEEILTKTGR